MTPNRVWFARDCWLSADPKVEQLGARHGGAAVLAYEEVLALAKLADGKGTVVVAFAVLAKRAWLKNAAQARKVIASMVELGLIVASDPGPDDVVVIVPKWTRWQINDPTAADRKSRQRERDRHENVTALERDGTVTSSVPDDRDVTPLQKYRQQNVKDLPPLAPTEKVAENRGTP